MKKAWEDGKE